MRHTPRVGTAAPSFAVTAVRSNRAIAVPPNPAVPILLIFHDHRGAELVGAVQTTARSLVASPVDLLVASVIDLAGIPRFVRKVTQTALEAAYDQSAQRLPADIDPADYVIILPDWDGKITKAYDMAKVVPGVGVALVDGSGILRGASRTSDPVASVRQWLTPFAPPR
jgi:hypothetical protein